MEKWRIQSCDDLYEILHTDENELQKILENKKSDYYYYKIKKISPKKIRKKDRIDDISKERIIHVLQRDARIRILQKNLSENILSKHILFPDCVYGFLRERSYEDFLYAHISERKDRVLFRLDIRDFFDSIRYKDLQEALEYYISPECGAEEKKKILDLLCQTVTLNHHLVQGAVTSPLLSNLVFRSLDIRIMRYCQNSGVCYTRYADDLLFSVETEGILRISRLNEQSPKKEIRKCLDAYINRFIKRIAAIISEKGFALNYAKTVRGIGELSLGGFVIGNEVRLARKKQHKLNKILYDCSAAPNMNSRNKLAGFRSFYIQMLRYATQSHTQESLKRRIRQIEETLDRINAKLPVDSVILDECI